MITAAIYIISTGEILQRISGPGTLGEISAALPAEWGAVEITGDEDENLYWYNGSAVVPRPDLDSSSSFANPFEWQSDGVDEITFGPNLPNPTRITVTCSSKLFTGLAPFDVTDGELNLTCTTPGTYTIVFEAWPYLTKTLLVEAF